MHPTPLASLFDALALTRIIGSLLEQHPGAQAYWVGGAVRDSLRTGQLPEDIDLVLTRGTSTLSAKWLSRQLADYLNASWVVLDDSWGIYRIVMPALCHPQTVDIADALHDDIEQDLARRDLTVNAMALSVNDASFLDPYNGAGDLQSGTIRMLSESNLVEDPLRLLRVFRIAATIEAHQYDSQTLETVRRHAQNLHFSAVERQHVELFKLLNAPAGFRHLQAMADSGLLDVILPELTPCRTIPGNTHHHLPLFEHSLEVARQCEVILPTLPAQTQATLTEPLGGSLTRFGAVKLSGLLHDVGKPDTMAFKDDGRPTFYGHEALSAKLSDSVCARLKTSSVIMQRLHVLCRWHLYPCALGPQSSQKAIMKFFRRISDATPDLILLALADRFATKGTAISAEDLATSEAHHRWLLKAYYETQTIREQPRLLTGNDIMSILNLKPGRKVGEWLARIEEAQHVGDLTTPDEARRWLLTAAHKLNTSNA
ncbi:MAG: HD domain-containing protein [Vampirovibrionales bacterium]|nr:HD domain-containing protein [Vampirovibrionales bacterium]